MNMLLMCGGHTELQCKDGSGQFQSVILRLGTPRNGPIKGDLSFVGT